MSLLAAHEAKARSPMKAHAGEETGILKAVDDEKRYITALSREEPLKWGPFP
jgi:hypothetical protein